MDQIVDPKIDTFAVAVHFIGLLLFTFSLVMDEIGNFERMT